eukprot:XP_011662350.1 PREDICTED: uncharacterized protein LOC100893789 [Strongylocentrotus purpuratus]
MAASSSRFRSGPVNLSEVRHEQRRVAALLNASGQIKVAFPPNESTPVKDLYKSRFYRELQAAKSLPSRVPPLGHPLVRLPGWKQTDHDNPLVSNQYGHFGNGDDGSSVAALAHSFQDQIGGNRNIPDLNPSGQHSYSRRRAVALKRTLSKSVPSSLRVDLSKKSNNGGGNSLSRYESLPDIGQSARQGSGSKIEYRLPRRRRGEPGSLDMTTEGSTGPPHLQYNHGIVDPGGKLNPRSISQVFSPTGWRTDDTDIDLEPLQKQNKTLHRKRKHQSLTNPFMRTYEHDDVPFNSLASSASSFVKPSSRESDTSSSSTPDCNIDGDPCPDDNDHQVNEPDVDKQKNVKSPSNDPQGSASGSNLEHPQPKGSHGSGGVNPNDDPYGTAYVKALSVARSKAIQEDPFYLSHRLTRPFTFSYFCQKDVCTCGKCPKVKRKKGKSGLKSILGDVNMYDYFKWSKDRTDGK